jgi:hypothetical protein
MPNNLNPITEAYRGATPYLSVKDATCAIQFYKRPFGARNFALLTAVFAVSRVLYYWIGVRFNIETLPSYLQYIDPALLRTDLWRSLLYLEQQPPAFNLYLGVILHLFPNHAALES